MRHIKTTLAVLGAAMILVLAGNSISMATTGHAFLLGKSNSASTITRLTKTTSGPALNLTTKTTANAPFSTNGKGKVTNLNADKLDGLDSSQLTTTTTVLSNTDTSTDLGTFHTWNFTVAPGTYHLAYTIGLTGSGAFEVVCGFYNADLLAEPPYSVGWQSATSNGTSHLGAWISGTGTETVTASKPHLTLFCNSSVAMKLESETGLRIEITKINSSAAGTVSNRIAPKAAHVAVR